MMADQVSSDYTPPPGRRRVKVYELRNSDWFDRGTGFCTGQIVDGKALINVESEDSEEIALLTSDILAAQDGYQKQQDTLIVWTEHNGLDMALSFQEPEGCAVIWLYIHNVQSQMMPSNSRPDESTGDFPRSSPTMSFSLPAPHIQNLQRIDHIIRQTSISPPSRDALTKILIQEQYIAQLCPVFEMAEDLESLNDLHLLCNIVKTIILLNDSELIESIVSDELVLGVVGMLEYDPDFPSHKANHRTYLSDASKFKEVIPIEDPEIKRKIHVTYRLQYLKDVVLARILDDPTFSVLSSLIFFNQLEVVQRLQQSPYYFKQLFGLFARPEVTDLRKKNAILLISQCCTYAKNQQPSMRTELWTSLVSNGLFHVIVFALRSTDPSIRVAGTDVFVSLIDHDTSLIRVFISQQILEKETPLTDLLIDMLLREGSHGVKVQLADAIKVLLDNTASQALEAKIMSMSGVRPRGHFESNDPEVGAFLTQFYEHNGSVHRLFKPLKDLKTRTTLDDLTINEVSTFSVLIELLSIFMKQHTYRSKYFIVSESIPVRIAQFLAGPEKQLQLHALKFFRRLVEHGDENYIKQMQNYHLLGPILDIVTKTMPKNNLLNSASLEFFTHLHQRPMDKRKLALLEELVDQYRDRIEKITYVPTFRNCIEVYDRRMEKDIDTEMTDGSSFETGTMSDTLTGSQRAALGLNGGRHRMMSRWSEMKDLDVEEEHYFDTSDDEDDDDELMNDVDFSERVMKSSNGGTGLRSKSIYPVTLPSNDGPHINGIGRSEQGPPSAQDRRSSVPLVDYPEEEDDDDEEAEEREEGSTPPTSASASPLSTASKPSELDSDLTALRPKPLILKSSPRSQRPPSKIPLKSGPSSQPPNSSLSTSQPPRRPTLTSSNSSGSSRPPERISEKRRREENEEDDLSKHIGRDSKRRNSVTSGSGASEDGQRGSRQRHSAGPFSDGTGVFRRGEGLDRNKPGEGLKMERGRKRWSLHANAGVGTQAADAQAESADKAVALRSEGEEPAATTEAGDGGRLRTKLSIKLGGSSKAKTSTSTSPTKPATHPTATDSTPEAPSSPPESSTKPDSHSSDLPPSEPSPPPSPTTLSENNPTPSTPEAPPPEAPPPAPEPPKSAAPKGLKSKKLFGEISPAKQLRREEEDDTEMRRDGGVRGRAEQEV